MHKIKKLTQNLFWQRIFRKSTRNLF